MSRKIYAAILPLLAVAVCGLAPAVASAAPHWYVSGVRLPFTGATTAVKTSGTLTFNSTTVKVTCKVKDKGNIWNTSLAANGMDDITEFVNTGCTAVPATACSTPELLVFRTTKKALSTFPLATELEEKVSGVIRDRIGKPEKEQEVEVELRCSGALADTFTGTLTPKIVNDSPSFAEFDTPGSGTLKDGGGNLANVTGNDNIEGASGEKVEAKNP